MMLSRKQLWRRLRSFSSPPAPGHHRDSLELYSHVNIVKEETTKTSSSDGHIQKKISTESSAVDDSPTKTNNSCYNNGSIMISSSSTSNNNANNGSGNDNIPNANANSNCSSTDNTDNNNNNNNNHNNHHHDGNGMKKTQLRSALNLFAMLSEVEKAQTPPRPRDTRTLRFSSTVHVCLIPSRDELKNLFNELYWTSDEYVTFKSDAVQELRIFLTANGLSAKEAISQLYQPREQERIQWMKEHQDWLNKKATGGDDSEATDRESNSTVSYNSDDDEEPYYAKAEANEIKFFQNVKTDIELNATAPQQQQQLQSQQQPLQQQTQGQEKAQTPTTTQPNLPTRTPSAGSSMNGHVWAVQWKPTQK